MRLVEPRGGWKRYVWRLVALVAILLVPLPGIASSFSDAMADGCAALASLLTDAGSEVHFVSKHYGAEHPWWVQLAVRNVFTGKAFEVPVDTRTVAYVRIAVFLSLAVAWPFWTSRRAIAATAGGFALLLGSIALSIVLPLLQALEIVQALELGRLVQSIVSVGILTLLTYPSMAFAVPSLLWFATVYVIGAGSRRAGVDAAAAPPSGAQARQGAAL
jgi:hypothetical protein